MNNYVTKNAWAARPKKGGGLLVLTSASLLLVIATTSRPLAAAPFAYVTNFYSGTVSVIDTATNTVVATPAVGTQPYGIAVTPDGSHVYVANEGSGSNLGSISVIDTSNNSVTTPISYTGGKISIPIGVAITPDGNSAYVTNFGSASVAVIATATNTVTTTIPVGGGPSRVAITPDGTKAYVSNQYDGTVSVISTATNTVMGSAIPVGSSPSGVAITPDGTHVYVTNYGGNTVSVIATATNTVTATIIVGSEPIDAAITPDGTQVYVTNYDSSGEGTVSVIATATNNVTTITLGNYYEPIGIAITGDGTKAYVVEDGNWTVAEINTATNAVTGSPIGVGEYPFSIGIQKPSSQTITFNSLPNEPYGTAPITVSATASSGLTVSFNSQTPTYCTVSGTYGATVTLGAVGTCTIQATQAGNNTYAAAMPVIQSFQITSATLLSQTITFSTLSNEPVGTLPFTVSASATSGLTVSFASLTTPICTVAGTTVTIGATPGACTIEATQTGNSTYAAASPVENSFQVLAAPPLYGTFARANQFDLAESLDFVAGNLGTNLTPDLVGSGFGLNYALANFEPITFITSTGSYSVNDGPGAGVESASNLGKGSAQAVSFASFQAPGTPFKVNAVLHGYFWPDCCSLPNGNMAAAGQILVVDATKFSALLAGLTQLQIQHLLMGTPGVPANSAPGPIDPDTAITNLQAVFAGMVYGRASVSLNNYGNNGGPSLPYSTPINESLTTNLISNLNPQTPITVILQAAADSLVGGIVIDGAGGEGTGEVDFIHTLAPAPNFFSDANGNPISGVSPYGPAPATTPTAGNITLAPLTATNLAGTAATFTATVTDTTSAPLPGAVVSFSVTSGPDVGLMGGGVTNASGQAVLTYLGKNGAGTDIIQATTQAGNAEIPSNIVSETWTLNALSSGSSCNGAYNGTFDGNLTITAGQNCTLAGGTVTGNIMQHGGSLTIGNSKVGGNVQIQGGGTFSIGPYAVIDGNLQIQDIPAGTALSQVCGATVLGNLQYQNNGTPVQIGALPPASCQGSTIGGNLQVQNNTASGTIVGNTVGGNLQDMSNTAPTQVFNNTVNGNLQCQSNSSITGGGNTAAGHKQGQCVAF